MRLERRDRRQPNRFAPSVDGSFVSDVQLESPLYRMYQDRAAEDEPMEKEDALTIAEQHEKVVFEEHEKSIFFNACRVGSKHWLFLATVLVAIWTASPATWREAAPTKSSGPLLKQNLPPCFISFPTKDEDKEESPHFYDWCDESKDTVPCPFGGTCSNGQLITCDDSYERRFSKTGDQCILSAVSKEMLMITNAVKKLAELTAGHFCSIRAGGINTAIDTSPKLFDISVLIGTSPALYDLLLSSDAFIFEINEDGSTMIGLSEKMTRRPFRCRYRIAHTRFMEYIEPHVRYTSFFIWFLIKSSPFLPPFIGVVVAFMAMIWRRHCKEKHKA